VAEKAFALAIAGSGLVAFALTVALIQQARRARPPGLPARAHRRSVLAALVARCCCAAGCFRCCRTTSHIQDHRSSV